MDFLTKNGSGYHRLIIQMAVEKTEEQKQRCWGAVKNSCNWMPAPIILNVLDFELKNPNIIYEKLLTEVVKHNMPEGRYFVQQSGTLKVVLPPMFISKEEKKRKKREMFLG